MKTWLQCAGRECFQVVELTGYKQRGGKVMRGLALFAGYPIAGYRAVHNGQENLSNDPALHNENLDIQKVIARTTAEVTNAITVGFVFGLLFNVAVAIGITMFANGEISQIVFGSIVVSAVLYIVGTLFFGFPFRIDIMGVIVAIRTIELSLASLAIFYLGKILFLADGADTTTQLASNFTWFLATAFGVVILAYLQSVFQVNQRAAAI